MLTLSNNQIITLSRGGSWYDCNARGVRGRVVTWSNYLVQYDVVTGKSSTRLLPNRRFGPELEAESAFEYKPIFHMDPLEERAKRKSEVRACFL